MSTILAKLKRLYSATEAALTPAAMQWGYAADTRRIVAMESDGVTKRYYWDSTRLADQTTSYGTSLIGTPGITGVTPTGGSSGAAATLQAMLGGLKDYAAGVVVAGIGGTTGNILKKTGSGTAGDSILSESSSKILFSGDTVANLYRSAASTLKTDGALVAAGDITGNDLTALNTLIGAYLNISGQASLHENLVLDFYATLGNSLIWDSTSGNGSAVSIIPSLTKNNANSRTFYGQKTLLTLNSGESNSNTLVYLMAADTVNTGITGVTTYLLSLKYGGSERVRYTSEGRFWNGNSAIEGTGADTALLNNAPALNSTTPYTWIDEYSSDGTLCCRPTWKKSS